MNFQTTFILESFITRIALVCYIFMFFAHVLLKFMCVIEFFLAFIAGEFVPWVVQMYKTNVFLETMLFTKNLITISASILQALVDTLDVLFQI